MFAHFASFDLSLEYWQTYLDDLNSEKTAFVTPDKHRIRPIGLHSARNAFVDSLMNTSRPIDNARLFYPGVFSKHLLLAKLK